MQKPIYKYRFFVKGVPVSAHIITINTPLTKDIIQSLRIGDQVLINGTIYAARDAAHKRMIETLIRGEQLPIILKDQIIYYVGPSPAKPGQIIGSAGPTTAGRMDSYTPELLQHGLAGMIGKGKRSHEVLHAMKRYGAVYFATIAGAGALLSKHITKYSVIAYPDLGPEALAIMEIKDFPAIVAGDAYGRDFYLESARHTLSKQKTRVTKE